MRPVKCGWFVLGLATLLLAGASPAAFGQGRSHLILCRDGSQRTNDDGDSRGLGGPAIVRLSVNAFFNTVNGLARLRHLWVRSAVSVATGWWWRPGRRRFGRRTGGLRAVAWADSGGLRSVGGFDAGGERSTPE